MLRYQSSKLRRAALPIVLLLSLSPMVYGSDKVPSATSPLSDDRRDATDTGLTYDYAVTRLVEIDLPIVDTAFSRKRSAAGGPLEIGFHRDMPVEYRSDISQRLHWLSGNGDTIVAAIQITSPGAAALRVAIRVDHRSDWEMRFFGEEPTTVFPVIRPINLNREDKYANIVWSPVVVGETIGVEIALPSSEALSSFELVLEKISHIHTLQPSSSIQEKEAECGNHIDVQCREDVFPNGWAGAVAKIVFEEGGRSLACSGTLLNDTVEGSFVPYFLTANHCLSTSTAARTVTAYWFFQRAACGDGDVDERYLQSPGGADLLATSSDQDATLLRLRGRLPGGLTFAGWTGERLDHPTRVFGIHHPGGGLKKFSAGATLGVEEVHWGLRTFNGINTHWHEGVTEAGSSGSGLFRHDDGSLVGNLSGGERGCYAGADVYGSFADFFPSIRRWLAPSPSESQNIDDHGDTPASATETSTTSTVEGRVESSIDLDYFRLELATAGTLRVETTGSMDTVGLVYRADGRVRLEDDNTGLHRNFQIVATVPAGTYFIEVRGYAESTGNYRLEISFDAFATGGDHGDRRTDATTIATESVTGAELNWGNDLDYFRIELTERGELSISTTGDTDTFGTLFAHNGFVLQEDDDSGDGLNFLIEIILEPGVYYVEVSGLNRTSTGAYSLQVDFDVKEEVEADDHGDTPGTSTLAAIASVVEGNLERNGDIDYFRFEVSEPSTLWIHTIGGVDTDGSLIDGDERTIQNDFRKGLELLIVDDASSGEYYIMVRGATDETTGKYVLSILADPIESNSLFRKSTLVDVPSSTSHTLEDDEVDYFQIELSQNGTFIVETTGTTDTQGTLLDDEGNVLAENDDFAFGLNFRIEESLASGTYFVEVRTFQGVSGTYTLVTSFEEFSLDAMDVVVPSSTSSDLADNEIDYFRLELTEVGLLKVETTGDLNTQGRLLTAFGRELSRNDDGGVELNFRIERLATPGIYYVEVQTFQGIGGSYQLEISFDAQISDASVEQLPVSIQGKLERFERRDSFAIRLAEPGVLFAATTGDVDTLGTLMNADGDVLAENDDGGPDVNFAIVRGLDKGFYTIDVSGYDGGVGAYTLHLQLLQTHRRFLDHDGDGRSDILLRHRDGHWALYHMDAWRSLNNVPLELTQNRDWRMTGFVNLSNGDIADAMLVHTDGRWLSYSITGLAEPARLRGPVRLPSGTVWSVVASGDFLFPSENEDLLLRNLVGSWREVRVRDALGSIVRIPTGLPRDLQWQLIAFGDFGGYGVTSLLFQHSESGSWRHYQVGEQGGGSVWASWPFDLSLDRDFTVRGVGDLNGDGNDDILSRNPNGEWEYVALNGSGMVRDQSGSVDLPNDSEWYLAGIGDLNGDGTDDVLLRHNDGRWSYYAMDGHEIIDEHSGEAELPNEPAWSVPPLLPWK